MRYYCCHSKMITHRDIKPDNIIFDKYNRVKLAESNILDLQNNLIEDSIPYFISSCHNE